MRPHREVSDTADPAPAAASLAANCMASKRRHYIQYERRQAEKHSRYVSLQGTPPFRDWDYAEPARVDHREPEQRSPGRRRRNSGSPSRSAPVQFLTISHTDCGVTRHRSPPRPLVGRYVVETHEKRDQFIHSSTRHVLVGLSPLVAGPNSWCAENCGRCATPTIPPSRSSICSLPPPEYCSLTGILSEGFSSIATQRPMWRTPCAT
jgi:hypothetical protein